MITRIPSGVGLRALPEAAQYLILIEWILRMAFHDETITCVPDALEMVQGDDIKAFFAHEIWPHHKFPFGLWFRGHSRTKLKLEPRAFRGQINLKDPETGAWDETNVYDVLRLRSPLQRQTYTSAFEWLCLMQHYSLPTRLLDWSEGVLTALFFAVFDDSDSDGELIVLNAKRLNRRSKDHPTIYTPTHGHVVIRAEMATTRSARKLCRKETVVTARKEEGITDEEAKEEGWLKKFCEPIAVFPNRLNDRMTLQSSMFTLHGGKHYVPAMKPDYEDDDIPPPVTLDDLDLKDEPILRRYLVPKKEVKERILNELFILGIHEGTLFPEIERQAAYLKKLWWYNDEPTTPKPGQS